MLYLSEFDRIQLKKQIAGIKSDLGKLMSCDTRTAREHNEKSIQTTLRAMGMILSENQKIPPCLKCGREMDFICKNCK